MEEPNRFAPIRVLPAAAMLAVHAVAMALSTRMPQGQTQEIWTGFHIAAALAEVITLSLATRSPRPSGRWHPLLWSVPALDFLATVVLTAVLRVR